MKGLQVLPLELSWDEDKGVLHMPFRSRTAFRSLQSHTGGAGSSRTRSSRPALTVWWVLAQPGLHEILCQKDQIQNNNHANENACLQDGLISCQNCVKSPSRKQAFLLVGPRLQTFLLSSMRLWGKKSIFLGSIVSIVWQRKGGAQVSL